MRTRSLMLLAAACLTLAGCKQNSPASTGSTTASVALALTNADLVPVLRVADLDGIAHVYVTIQAVEVHMVLPEPLPAGGVDDADDDMDGRWLTMLLPAEPTLDLMTLQNGVTAALGRLTVLPAGKITQIRLMLDPQRTHEVVLANGSICALDLSEVPSTGIKITHPFQAIDVDDIAPVRIVVDVDLHQSVMSRGTCSYVLDPVIAVGAVERGDAEDDGHEQPTSPDHAGEAHH